MAPIWWHLPAWRITHGFMDVPNNIQKNHSIEVRKKFTSLRNLDRMRFMIVLDLADFPP
jgi:hypothetical protein